MLNNSKHKWLTDNQYQRIHHKAKKMGAKDICLNALWHCVRFQYTNVAFMFDPFQYNVSMCGGVPSKRRFSDGPEADEIKADMNKALEFIEYIKSLQEPGVEL